MDREVLQAINGEVQKAILDSQNSLLSQMNVLVTNKFQNFQQSQKEFAETHFNKLQEEFLVNDNYRFNRKSCEDQFKFNVKVNSALRDAKCVLDNETSPGACEAKKKISESIDLIHQRQKLVRLADSSEYGWRVVQEYTANPIASDSEDDKKITRAENKAERKFKAFKKKKNNRRFNPYPGESTQGSSQTPTTGGKTKPGVCYKCFKPGHWQRECPQLQDSVAKKISTNLEFLRGKSLEVAKHDYEGLYSHLSVEFCSTDTSQPVHIYDINMSPVGRLRRALDVWRSSGAIDNVISVISNGYGLHFKVLPDAACLRNNKSAADNPVFVSQEIQKLLSLGSISCVDSKPLVVNPLTVAYSRSGKARLVLDCRHININLHRYKFKFEDVSVAKGMFYKGDYLFKFDLKSPYHHIEILPSHRTYLGFCWSLDNVENFFVFNVLPFGISVAGYIFTKVLKEVVKYWRSLGYKVIMYLDDGLAGAASFEQAECVSKFVHKSLQEFGFLISEEKCVWQPTQNLTWLGYCWDMVSGCITVTPDRVDRLLSIIDYTLSSVGKGIVLFKAKHVACIIGQVISMQTVFGKIVRLKTRSLYNCILKRASWQSLVPLDSSAVDELEFWKDHAFQMNSIGTPIQKIELCDVVMFTDASSYGYGGYVEVITTENDADCGSFTLKSELESVDSVDYCSSFGALQWAGDPTCIGRNKNLKSEVTGSWSNSELKMSSTWRKLEAMSRVLQGSLPCLKDKHVKWHTDNKNVTSIVQVGSRKSDLHHSACVLYDICDTNNINIVPQWIPRYQNILADSLSRLSDCDDWGIQVWLFKLLDKCWGPYTVDRFATDYNTKCTRFNSRFWCYGTENIDAFTVSWKNENNWLVPPPRLLCKTFEKVVSEKAQCTVVLPVWRTAAYWPFLCPKPHMYSSFVSDVKLLPRKDIVIKGLGILDYIKDQAASAGVSQDDTLGVYTESLAHHLVDSRSDNTARKYFSSFKRWEQFITSHNLVAIPAAPIHVALYISHLLDCSCSFNTIASAIYSIKWIHDLHGKPDPTDNGYVRTLLESSKRTAKKTVNKKDPVTSEMLIKLCNMYAQSTDVLIVRDLSMILLAFSAYLRFDELSSLRCSDISIHDDYLCVKIRHSKTDQYRQGDEVLISKGSTLACPYSMFIRYVSLTGVDMKSDHYLFKPVYRSNSKCNLIFKNKPLSYTAARESIIKRLKLVSDNLNLGLHSLRSGGATAAANSEINDRCWKRHGRWKSDSSKDGYVADSVNKRLKVSQVLGL